MRLFYEAAAHQGVAVQAVVDRVAARIRGAASPDDSRHALQRQALESSLEVEADARRHATEVLFDSLSDLPKAALLRLVRQMHRMAHGLGESFQAIPSGGDGQVRACAAEITDVLAGALQAVLQAIAALGAHGVECDDVSTHCNEARPLVHCAQAMANEAMMALLTSPNVAPSWAIAWRFVFQRMADAAGTCERIADELELLRSELSVRRASAQQILY